MRHHPLSALAATIAIAVVAAGAGVSAPTSDAAMLAPSAGSLSVTLHRTSVGCASRTATRGLTTFVVRNARAGATSFVLARHSGGMNTLPRFEGMPFVPANEVVARLHRIPTGRQRRIAATLTRGEYFLVATQSASGTIFADAGMTVRVR